MTMPAAEKNVSDGDTFLQLAHAGVTIRRNSAGTDCSVPRPAAVPDSVVRRAVDHVSRNSCNEELIGDDYVFPLFLNALSRFVVVCVHPVTGGLWEYREFIARTPMAWSAYGIHAGHWFRTKSLPQSIAHMANEYSARLMRTDIVQRPFVIYGISSGGLIAIEIARALADRGRVAKCVILGDTQQQPDEVFGSSQLAVIGDRFRWLMFLNHCLPPEVQPVKTFAHAFWRMREHERIDEILRLTSNVVDLACPITFSREDLSQRFDMFREYLLAYRGHLLRPYFGRVAYVMCAQSNPHASQELRRQFAGGQRCENLAGTHIAMLGASGAELVWDIARSELQL